MSDVMRCPRCEAPMEEGVVVTGQGSVRWGRRGSFPMRVGKEYLAYTWSFPNTLNGWRCAACRIAAFEYEGWGGSGSDW